MNPPDDKRQSWIEIEPHLDRVLELEPPARDRWLCELDTTNPGLAATLRTMLAERDELEAAGFLSGSLLAENAQMSALQELLAGHAERETSEFANAVTATEGQSVGPYRLLREIGHGGMSTVWLAERSDGQLKRAIALKLAYAGPRMRVERFLRERDILAQLTHPQIARLYDAGISESGQPYLAMEYVEGTALLQSADERRLGIRERLGIFLQVLEAVQFAHAGLIIHRDLKPSNILLTAQNRAVLLDFGVAKLLSDDEVQSSLTEVAGRPFTPDYASPEQIAGMPLGVATDIYSLGIVLYELLTGNRPHRAKRDSRAAIEEAILADDVKPASQTAITEEAAAARGSNPRALARALDGDLDTILLKALRKDASERYVSVTAFAQDIDNHLHDLPVSARPASRVYRLGRFVSRHRGPVAAASVALLAIIGGALLALWQAREAEHQKDRAVALASRNEAVTAFLGAVLLESADADKPVTPRELLERSERLALANTSESPEHRAAMLEMIAGRYFSINEMQRAADVSAAALRLLENSPDQAWKSRVACERAMVVAEIGDAAPAIAAIKAELGKLDDDPETAATCLTMLSTLCWNACPEGDSLRYALDALERNRRAPGTNPGEPWILSLVGYGHYLVGHSNEADRFYRRSMDAEAAIGRETSPEALSTLNNWGISMSAAGMPRRAVELYDQIARIEAAREPGADPSTGNVNNRARAQLAMGNFAAAGEGFERLCQLAERHDDRAAAINCRVGLGTLALEANDLPRATNYLREAGERLDRGFPQQSPLRRGHTVLSARLDVAEGRTAQARRTFEELLAIGKRDQYAVTGELGLASLDLAAGDVAKSVAHAQNALAAAQALQGGLPHSHYTGQAALALARALERDGKQADARAALETAITQLSNTVEPTHPGLIEARAKLQAQQVAPSPR